MNLQRLRGVLTFAFVAFAATAAGAIDVDDATRAAWTYAAPTDPDAAMNLGVTAAREGEIGHAVLWLERAHRLAPLDREISEALLASQREARRLRAEAMPRATLVEGEPAGMSSWRFFGATPARLVIVVLVASSWFFFGSLFVARRAKRHVLRDAAIVVAVVSAIIGAVFGGLRVGTIVTSRALTPAVVVDDTPSGRDAPDELSPSRREPNLYPGALTLVRSTRPGWVEVELVDGARLWVRPGAVVAINQAEIDPTAPVTSPR